MRLSCAVMLPSLEAAIIYCFEVDRLLSQVRDTVQKRKLCPQIAEARKFHAAALFVLHCGAASSFFLRSLFFDTTIPYTKSIRSSDLSPTT